MIARNSAERTYFTVRALNAGIVGCISDGGLPDETAELFEALREALLVVHPMAYKAAKEAEKCPK